MSTCLTSSTADAAATTALPAAPHADTPPSDFNDDNVDYTLTPVDVSAGGTSSGQGNGTTLVVELSVVAAAVLLVAALSVLGYK
jgi:hypothetical protein